MEMADAKISMMIIAVKILGAEEGFRPKAAMLANPDEAMIAQGPRMQKKKIRMMETSLFMLDSPRLLDNHRHLV